MLNDNTLDITLENFQQVMIEDSKTKVIMVQFWAENSEVCRDISPILLALASEYSDSLTLAKVNVHQQQEIVTQFGVQGLPTVILVKEGRPIDGFAGPKTESEVRELLEKHLPKAEDDLLLKGQELIAAGNYQEAFTLLKQAYELNDSVPMVRLALADCNVEVGQVDQAKHLLATITLVDQDSYYHSILGKVELAEAAAESPEIKALEAQLAEQPDNMELKVSLAVQLHQAHKHEDALGLLWSVLQKDLNFGDAKKVSLDIINALPDGEPLKSLYRRKIYSLLY